MPLSWSQRLVAESPQRFRVVCAGRRWGKTHLALRELARFASQPNQLCYYVSPSYKMSKNILWRKIKRRLSEINWVRKINETELTLELVNGSVIMLKGADNFDSLRGVGINFLVMDEMADIAKEAWTEVLRPTLSDTNGHALIIGTPKGGNHFKDLYDQAKTTSGWVSFQFTTVDGGNVAPEEIEAARQDLDLRTFRQEYLATFEEYSGRIAWNFDRNLHVKTLTKPNLATIYVGCDFNVSPITAVIMVRQGNDLYVIDEIYMHNSNTQEMADEILRRYPKMRVGDVTGTQRIECFPDPAGSQRRTSAGGSTDHNILSNNGFVVRAPRSHTPVKDRINALNSRLLSADGSAHLFVNPACKHTLNSLEKYCYKEGTQVPDKDSGYDHMFDALSYAVDYLFPLRRAVEPQAQQRWGHEIANPRQGTYR